MICVAQFLTSHLSPFCDTGLSRSLPGNSGISDVEVNERDLRHSGNDGWTSVPTIVVPGRDGHDPGPALGGTKTGGTSVTDELNTTNAGRGNSPVAVGFCRSRKSRTIGPSPLGRSGKVERLAVGSPATEQRSNAGNQRVEAEEETRKDGKWGESGHRTATNTNLNISPSESDGGGSNSNPQRGGLVRNDRFGGMYFDPETTVGFVSGLIDAIYLSTTYLVLQIGIARQRAAVPCPVARFERGMGLIWVLPLAAGTIGSVG